jgi:CRISPR-associated exonuclease Cas4
LAGAQLKVHPYWKSESLRLVGIPDAALLTTLRVGILEFKDTPHKLTRGTKLQLAAYDLLAGELFPHQGRVVLFHDPQTGQTSQVPISDSMRQEVLNIRDDLDDMIHKESLPEPTPDVAKCVECEYRRSCSDVLL